MTPTKTAPRVETEPLTVRDIREDREALAALRVAVDAAEVERLRKCSCWQCQKRLKALMGG